MLLLCLCAVGVQAQDEKTYNIQELKQPPTYPGGMTSFYSYLGTNIKYPSGAAENNVQGYTYVSFIVEKDGSINEVKTTEPRLGSGTDEEAIRVISASKRWNPAVVEGKAVRAKMMLPIKFAMPAKSSAKVLPKAGTGGKEDPVYNSINMETPPVYPGGIKKFYETLSANISYPKEAIKAKKEGTTYLTFVIEKNGTISNVNTDGRKLGYGLDEEAIRVLKLSQNWMPGKVNGKTVRAKYNLPVKFTLNKK
ncbi:hypothetical protein D9M68_570120 [compost metagenome]